MKSPYNKSTNKKNVLRYEIDVKKFWAGVDIKKSHLKCWLWRKARNTSGYGLFTVNALPEDYERTGRPRTQILAHRVAYALNNEDLTPGIYVCHTCDTPACCNPAHLWAGTAKENVDDMRAKGRDNYTKKPINSLSEKIQKQKDAEAYRIVSILAALRSSDL